LEAAARKAAVSFFGAPNAAETPALFAQICAGEQNPAPLPGFHGAASCTGGAERLIIPRYQGFGWAVPPKGFP